MYHYALSLNHGDLHCDRFADLHLSLLGGLFTFYCIVTKYIIVQFIDTILLSMIDTSSFVTLTFSVGGFSDIIIDKS